MIDYLFDTPYWLLAFFAVIGIGLLVSANARQERRLGRAGAAVLFIGAILALMSYVIDTDKETVLGRTRQLAAAVEIKDSAALDKLLHPGAIITGTQLDKGQIIKLAAEKVDQHKIKNVKVSPEEPRQITTGAIEVSATISANAEGLGMAGNSPTDWRFTWIKTPDGWRVREIRPLKFSVGNIDLQALISQRLR